MCLLKKEEFPITTTMTRWCVVACCNRTSDNKPARFFSFPKADERRQKWIQFVRTTRTDFTGPGLSHCNKVQVCDAHFEESCFLHKPWHQRPKLKNTAVPSIWAGCTSSSSSARCRTGTCLRAKLQDTVIPSKFAGSTSGVSRGAEQCQGLKLQDTAVPVLSNRTKQKPKLTDMALHCRAGSTLISASRTDSTKQGQRPECAGSTSVSPRRKKQMPKLTDTVVQSKWAGATSVSTSRTKQCQKPKIKDTWAGSTLSSVSLNMTKHAKHLTVNGELYSRKALKSDVSMPE